MCKYGNHRESSYSLRFCGKWSKMNHEPYVTTTRTTSFMNRFKIGFFLFMNRNWIGNLFYLLIQFVSMNRTNFQFTVIPEFVSKIWIKSWIACSPNQSRFIARNGNSIVNSMLVSSTLKTLIRTFLLLIGKTP